MEAIDSIHPRATIVSRMQTDAIRMRYYRGPLAIVCEENGRVNCYRSMNHKDRTLRRRSYWRKLTGASLVWEDLFLSDLARFSRLLHRDALLGF